MYEQMMTGQAASTRLRLPKLGAAFRDISCIGAGAPFDLQSFRARADRAEGVEFLAPSAIEHIDHVRKIVSIPLDGGDVTDAEELEIEAGGNLTDLFDQLDF